MKIFKLALCITCVEVLRRTQHHVSVSPNKNTELEIGHKETNSNWGRHFTK